jgi:hypothetical protein
MGGQQRDSLAERDGARQHELCLLGEDSGPLDSQRGGEITPAGMQRDQPSSADLCAHGSDPEHKGQTELDGSYLGIINQDSDRGMLGGRDLIPSYVHQLDAAGCGEGALRRGGEVMVLAPPRSKRTGEVDSQKSSRCRCDLAGGGFPGRPRQVLQGPAKVSVCVRRQKLPGQ